MLKWWSSTILLIRHIYLSLNYFSAHWEGYQVSSTAHPIIKCWREKERKPSRKKKLDDDILNVNRIPFLACGQWCMSSELNSYCMKNRNGWKSAALPNGKSRKEAPLLLSSADLYQEENTSSFSYLHLFCSQYALNISTLVPKALEIENMDDKTTKGNGKNKAKVGAYLT